MFLLQPFIETIAIVASVSDHTLRQRLYVTSLERVFDEGQPIRRRASNPDDDRKTMAVRDCHNVATFAKARWTNSVTPFRPSKRGIDEAFFQPVFPSGQQGFAERP